MKSFAVSIMAAALLVPGVAQAATAWLGDLDLEHVRQGWGEPKTDESVQSLKLRIAGTKYEKGLGTHAAGAIHVFLDGQATRFQALVGIDDETRGRGSAQVLFYTDDGLVMKTGVLRGGEAPAHIDLDLAGSNRLTIVMTDGGDGQHYDHVDFVDARIDYDGAPPKIGPPPDEPRVILTPRPGKAPRINGPRVYGVTPGNPFLFRIPCTGERPIAFSADELPQGLELDAGTGIITGLIADRAHKTHHCTLRARNEHGAAERAFRIVVGDTLALVPPMGWNHWYAHYDRITDAMMREAADIMVSSGMADVGYRYVNIDDCWMNAENARDPKRNGPFRDAQGVLQTNVYFPDMAALTAYIHAKGLKAGTYISPGPKTCAGYAGSYGHEAADAKLFADWGFDFLKYDWCSYDKIAKDRSLPELKKPYLKMSALLRQQDRDIVLNLCQYGMGEVWKWGQEVGGHCWRTAGDLGFELTGYYHVARRNADFYPYAGPGSWNDPDYLLVGYVGKAAGMGEPAPCPLTPNEQYSYMSLWCLMAAPLFFSGDMTRLDEFTLNVLCNPEVIDINQDPLGVQGRPVAEDPESAVWRKELEDGSFAVGLFNLSEVAHEVVCRWEDVGLTGKRHARDLWRHEDLGVFEDVIRRELPRHGVLLLRLTPVQ